MTIDRILPFTKVLLEKAVKAGDSVVDATAGNGHDTLYLSSLVTDSGQVFAFDVQIAAIEATRRMLEEAGITNAQVIHDSHANVGQYVSGEISAAIFNLGYLPGSDKTIVTQGESTWPAVLALLEMLRIGGVIILVVYHGHEEGKIERNYIESRIGELDGRATAVLKYEFLNKTSAPYIIAIEKMK